jgi:RNA polymerase primary sigma factor
LGTKTEALLADEASITEIDELKPLIAEGQERGILTVERIATSLEEVEVTRSRSRSCTRICWTRGSRSSRLKASP